MEILMAIKTLISGIFMTMNLPEHLLTSIKFELIAIKIVLNEGERNTAIYFSLQFSDHLSKH